MKLRAACLFMFILYMEENTAPFFIISISSPPHFAEAREIIED